MLSRINLAQKSTQAIVLCPTRELAIQVCEVLRSLAQYTTVEIAAAVPTERGAAKTKLTAQVVVGTPGTIDAKIAHRELDIRSVHMFVADEADQMIAQDGMREKTVQIKKKLPRNTQILLFSATFDEDTRKFAKVVAPQAVEIMVKTEELSLDGIKQYFMDARDEADKYKALTDIFSLLSIGQSIIFVHVRFTLTCTVAMESALLPTGSPPVRPSPRSLTIVRSILTAIDVVSFFFFLLSQTVATAKQLANQMRADGYTVSLLHGKDMLPTERDRLEHRTAGAGCVEGRDRGPLLHPPLLTCRNPLAFLFLCLPVVVQRDV